MSFRASETRSGIQLGIGFCNPGFPPFGGNDGEKGKRRACHFEPAPNPVISTPAKAGGEI